MIEVNLVIHFLFYLTRGDESLYNFLENKYANFKELFQSVELMVSNDLTEFCKKLKKLVDENGNEEKEEEELKQEKEKKLKENYFYLKKIMKKLLLLVFQKQKILNIIIIFILFY